MHYIRLINQFVLKTNKSIFTNGSFCREFSKTNIYNNYGKHIPNNYLDKSIFHRYKKQLKYDDTKFIAATYIWIDGTGENIRLKDRIINKIPKKPEDLPCWSFDGSSTNQAIDDDESDVILRPCAIYRDPFKGGKNDVIVLCDTYTPDGEPTQTNHRHHLEKTTSETIKDKPLFGIEQEYTLMDINNRPFGWPVNGYPAAQGPYYCGVGPDKVFARDLAESHTIACLYAGISFFGTNSEVMPSQWEYQIGTSTPLKVADDLWMSRYLLWRLSEEFGIIVTFHPKPMVAGDWNGSGAHCNYSTELMRQDGGIKHIEMAIEKLAKRHEEHIKLYDPKGGEYNRLRLSGRLESSSINTFSWGIANRQASVRITRQVAENGKGYLEDRRPASNMDPYVVCNAILRTTLLD